MAAKRKRAESPRDVLGLTAAEEGDIDGVEKLLCFMKRELGNLNVFSKLPLPVRNRLGILSKSMGDTLEFTRGFSSAQEYDAERRRK